MPGARCIVEIGGTRYDSRAEEARLRSAALDLTADRTSEAEISFADPDFTFTDRHLNQRPSIKCRVWMGYGESIGEPLFKGRLAGHEHDGEYATFRFHDQAAVMKRERKLRYHRGKTDFGMMRSIAEEHGLQFQLLGDARDSEAHPSLPQQGVTDWDFIRLIARRSGLRVWVEGDTLLAQKAGVQGGGGMILTYREDFLMLRSLSLSYRLPESRRGRHQRVAVHGRGPAGERITGEASGDDRGRVHQSAREDLTHHTRSEAERRAHAIKAGVRESAFENRIRLIEAAGATPALRGVVTLKGCGAFYGGDYVVHALRKEFRRGALVDELTLRRDVGRQKAAQKRGRAKR
jgi:phage protein D